MGCIKQSELIVIPLRENNQECITVNSEFLYDRKNFNFLVVYCYHVGVVVVLRRRPNTFSFRTLTLVKKNRNQ